MLHNGVQRGDRIGILCKNNHPFPSVMMASLKIGVVFIPLNHQLTVYELETIVKEAKLKVLVIDEEFSEVLLKIILLKLRDKEKSQQVNAFYLCIHCFI
ncbi:fatty-acid CoA ligase [Streptococcus pneumoniae]|nr:fatty-acid CoA ligase [Streptococcus pneumoniae]